MGIKKTKPSGAYADLKELEYISALHQTGKNELRKDGSIQAIDIVHFLMSRYGINVSEEEVRDNILDAFGECSSRNNEERNLGNLFHGIAVGNSNGGGDSDDNVASDGDGIKREEECLRLTQLLALLLIPTLLKAEQSLLQQKQTLSDSPINETESTETTITEQPSDNTRPLLTRFSTVRHREKGEKNWPDFDLIDYVLRIMMHDATGDATPKPLSRGLIKKMLRFYGETELAMDEQLLDEMMMAGATAYSCDDPDIASDVEGGALLFDQYAFARALTHDVQQYNIDNEHRLTTNYYDVFHTVYSTKEPEGKNKLRHRFTNLKTVGIGGDNDGGRDVIRPVQRVFTFPSIDYTAGTYRSRGFVVCLWIAWILTYFAYLRNRGEMLGLARLSCNQPEENQVRFGCALLQGITNWLIIMAQLSILGTTFIIWASIGNSVYPTNPLFIIFGMGAVVLFIVIPYAREFDAHFFSTKKSGGANSSLLYNLSLVCGIALLQRMKLQEKLSLPKFAQRFFTPGSIRLESQTKQAASCKANQLVRNACKIHKTAEFEYGTYNNETKYGKTLLAFSKIADATEESLGFLQVWKKIYSQALFKEDGICFTTHLLAGNVAQFTICLILAAVFVEFYKLDYFQEGLKYLDTWDTLTHQSQRWRLMLSLFFGFICGEGAVIYIAANYIPSTARTVLQYRSGGYESLHSKQFLKLRNSVDQSSLVFGSIFWGTFYTSVIIGVFFMLVLGLMLWPDFAEYTVKFFANIIGIGITILLKWFVLIGFRRKYQKAYYRKSVSLTNLVGVVLESWNLGLTTSYMIVRSLKLFIAATIFIGRLDIPFLSEDACFLGPFELDAYPLMFRKDVLAHEAHKHPYLERIGVMYMMKLRHRNFGNYAGTCWRMLFIHALMPWMRKYSSKEENLSILDFNFVANRMWTGRMPTQSAVNEESDTLQSVREPDGSKESDDSIAALRLQNQMLKKENETMRSLLFQNRSGKEISSSCPPIIFSKSSQAGHNDSIYTL